MARELDDGVVALADGLLEVVQAGDLAEQRDSIHSQSSAKYSVYFSFVRR